MVSGKYLKDYKIETFIDSYGKKKEKKVYTGPLYYWEINDDLLLKMNRQFMFSVMITWILFILSLWSYSWISHVWYVVLPYIILLLPLSLNTSAVYKIFRTKQPFTRENKDKMHSRVKTCFLAASILSGLTIICQTIAVLLSDKPLAFSDWFMIATVPVILILMIFCYIKSRQLKIRESENKTAE